VRVCPELIHWVLGFGPTARVISPPALRQAVQKELKEALARYSR
jgi:predicted DNA-binding transcriptional regulator YafY